MRAVGQCTKSGVGLMPGQLFSKRASLPLPRLMNVRKNGGEEEEINSFSVNFNG